ncbi:TOBE domain-containing protein [Vogesella sp. LIG4]|uniref:TOBE domain-containing protein n=1 Tax=Vogesella sp. LIG4 TaxID=1192162 RepID=UPI00081F9D91|nr:TOBE domain-containing protein [Vogesella sp. LIG4]SCK24068.1 molybdate transport system regulatory protein [Vogesella sp. LIG4]
MNQLPGFVTGVHSADGIHLLQVSVGEHHCTALALGDAAPASVGQQVMLGFREMDVALARDLAGDISIRNNLPCEVTALALGTLMARVDLRCGQLALHALITRQSALRLKLAPGMAVSALIKSHAMLLLQGVAHD